MRQANALTPPQTPAAPQARPPQIVTRTDLPLHCPRPGTALWSSHPRVFLAVDKTGRERCPYCGEEYVLQE